MSLGENMQTQDFTLLRSSYDEAMLTLRTIAKDFRELLRTVNEEGSITKNGYDEENFNLLQERSRSELLSIAFFGAFSSGKSFLISGLNHRVDWYERDKKEQYSPLLPTSPRHTSNCPVAVEPLTSGNVDKFTILFKGSDVWEQKTAEKAVIQAYVTDLPNAISQRSSNKDRTRTVQAARVGVSSAIMRVRLYDLPGFGAIGVNYEDIVRSFIQQADCVAYVAAASKPLDEKDLELLRDVYAHHKLTGKPVFFILTKIDLAWDIDTASGKIQWEDVRDANNEFLEQNFIASDGRVDNAFVGEGFIPVSPAFEAKGRSLLIRQPEYSQELVADSGMAILRERFNDYLKNTSGPMHLAELASEAKKLLSRLSGDITLRYLSEATPIRRVEKEIEGIKAQRRIIIEKKTMFEHELRALGQGAIRRAFAGSDPDDLFAFLSDNLSEKIRSSDVLQEKEIHQIETEKVNLVREWLNRSTKSLVPRWVNSWHSFYNQSNESVEHLLEEALAAKQKTIEKNNENDEEADITASNVERSLMSKYKDTRRQVFKDTFDLMTKTWGAWTVVAGVGAIGSVPQVVALLGLGSTPVGWGILATAVIGATYGRYKLVKQRDERRDLMLEEFNEYAHKIVRAYRTQADEFVDSRVGFLVEIIDNEIDRLSNSIDSLEQRLKTGDYISQGKRLEDLDALIRRSQRMHIQIDEFYTLVANTNTSTTSILSGEGQGIAV